MCPEAIFNPFNSREIRCANDDTSLDSLEISVVGVPPFTLYYEEEVNGVLSNLPKTIVVPNDEQFHSPLLSSKSKLGPNDLLDISWAKSHNVVVSIGGHNKSYRDGQYVYTISKIVDGFGNIIEYYPTPNNKDIYLSFNIHPMPSFSLIDSKPSIPILLGKKKFLDVKLDKLSCVDCEAPYTIDFKYVPFKNDTFNNEEQFTRIFDFKTPAQIEIEKPGLYSIEHGQSAFCDSKALGSDVSIVNAKLPKVDVELDSIVDKCVGTTGFKFKFEFVGNAPFEIGYKIAKLDPKDPKRVLKVESVSSLKTSSSVLEYVFNPSSEGSYSIEFVSLSDKFYKNQVRFNNGEYKYITYFQQRPRAFFNSDHKVQSLNICNGDKANLNLKLEGKQPFSITYDIIGPDYSIDTVVINDLNSSELKIETPDFFIGGKYIVALKDVKDSSNCDVDFKGQEVHLNVRNDIPHLNFDLGTDDHFEIVHGKSMIVPLSNSESINLIYSHEANGQTIHHQLNNFKPNDGLHLSQAGTYKLESFSQGGCKGEVADSTIVIDYLPKPYLELVPEEPLNFKNDHLVQRELSCQNEQSQVDLLAHGSGPFIIQYLITKPNNKIEERIEQLGNDQYSLKLQTDMAGDYQYSINGIYDSLYSENIINSLKSRGSYNFEDIVIHHSVKPSPSAKFLNKESFYQTCVMLSDARDNVEPISIQLQGELPLSLRLRVFHQSTGTSEILMFDNLQSHIVNLYSIYESLDVGTHTINIYEVIDGFGCIYTDQDLERQDSITINVNDLPKIKHLVEESKQVPETLENYYCVGDHISFLLTGIPPFSITYQFNDQLQKRVEVPANYFKRRAPGPGDLNIVSLSDSSAKGCEIEFTNLHRKDLQATVYDLPSVEIVQGESIEEDIFEGEQVEIIFKLSGTPPFKLTYIRTELDDERKIVETEVVDDILTNEYRIYAKLEGTYEAIEIQDRYCSAKNHKFT